MTLSYYLECFIGCCCCCGGGGGVVAWRQRHSLTESGLSKRQGSCRVFCKYPQRDARPPKGCHALLNCSRTFRPMGNGLGGFVAPRARFGFCFVNSVTIVGQFQAMAGPELCNKSCVFPGFYLLPVTLLRDVFICFGYNTALCVGWGSLISLLISALAALKLIG